LELIRNARKQRAIGIPRSSAKRASRRSPIFGELLEILAVAERAEAALGVRTIGKIACA